LNKTKCVMSLLNSLFKKKSILEDVLEVLELLSISPHQVKSEKTVERIIADYLSEYYEDVHCQYNVGGYLGLKIDIDILDGEVGIEIKLASSLCGSAANIQRLIGQAVYYQIRKYDKDLIVLIVGSKKDLESAPLIEVSDILTALGVNIFHLPTSRK